MPKRILPQEICTSEKINKLKPQDEVLLYRLLVNADDYGRYDGRPAVIRSFLFPLKDVTLKSCEDSIHSLVSAGLVERYKVDGQSFLHLLDWDLFQRLRTSHAKYPAPPDKCSDPQSSADICGKLPQVAADCRKLRPEEELEVEEELELESELEDEDERAKGRKKKQTKEKYGTFGRVLLTKDELSKLQSRFPGDWKERIDRLDEYVESKNVRYASHYATILSWARRNGDVGGQTNRTSSMSSAPSSIAKDAIARMMADTELPFDIGSEP